MSAYARCATDLGKEKTMKVIDRVEQLQAELKDITEEYCDNCQEFLCEYCSIVLKGGEDDDRDTD